VNPSSPGLKVINKKKKRKNLFDGDVGLVEERI